MKSKVYLLRKNKDELPGAMPELFAAAAGSSVKKGDSVAVKLHFGEPGNKAYLKPTFVKPVIEAIRKLGGTPFLTDANTLYRGGRSDTKKHLQSAAGHGYTKEAMGSDIVIADGPDGRDIDNVKVNLKHFKDVSLAGAATRADCMIVLTHFKGHELTGFGGSIKNVGMGLGSKPGKQRMHADVRPRVNSDRCIGDGECVKMCPVSAITLVNGKARINQKKCIGCAECVVVCPTGAIAISWAGTPDSVQEKMAEYTYGMVRERVRRVVYFNFIIDVSPNCDCYAFNDPPIVPDIGVTASSDIVAIDQACADLVNNTDGRIKGPDKFRALYPDVDWSVQLSYSERIGLGSRSYRLVEI